jgi:hypothetical protein
MQDKKSFNDKGERHGHWEKINGVFKYTRSFVNNSLIGYSRYYSPLNEGFEEKTYYAR